MKFKKPENENYCATIVKIQNIVQFENCDNIQGTTIFGNQIIISKNTNIGDIGALFTEESQLSETFLKENNLYREPEKNRNTKEKGYFEKNGRIKTMKFRGHQSSGLFVPLTFFSFTGFDINQFEVGDSFDEIKGLKICNKYFVPVKQKPLPGSKKQRKRIKESKVIENQFRFHKDTLQLGKNLHMFSYDDYISVTYKMHGTSAVISKILCKKKLNWFYKLLKKLKIDIVDKKYDNLYSSRKVIKNDDMSYENFIKKQGKLGYYNYDIWGAVNNELKDYLIDGITIYAEIVGFLPDGSYIQKTGAGYDYGYSQGTHGIYIYRITFTNPSGDVFEFSHNQMKEWCDERGLKTVPLLYYGKVKNFIIEHNGYDKDDLLQNNLLKRAMCFLEKDCYICKNKVPAEGIVIRKETNNFEAYKLKSFRFKEQETKQFDKGESNIEDEN